MGAPDKHNSRTDDLIAAVTRRLRPDAELQMDVANELRAHLEDAVAAARDSGLDDSAALDAALKSFGDADALEAQIFRANLRRMRLRAGAKWAFRLIATPAALLLALWLAWDAIAFLQFLDITGVSNGMARDVWSFATEIGARPEPRYLPPRPDLSAEERLLLNARPTSIEDAEALVRARPDDPVYLAHLAGLLVDKRPDALPKGIRRGLDVAERGERVDPNNAYWDYCRAALLMEVSGAARVEADPDFNYVARHAGIERPDEGFRLVLHDRALFERGLAAYRAGLAKPHYRSYDMEFIGRRAAVHRAPANVMDQVQLIGIVAVTPLPFLSHLRGVARCVLGYARLIIEEKRDAEALDLIRTAAVPGHQVGSDAHGLVELLTGHSIRQTALGMGAALYEQLGMPREAAAAREAAKEDSLRLAAAVGETATRRAYEDEMRRNGGLIASIAYGPVPALKHGLMPPMRRAERFFMERAVLAVLCAALLVFTAWFAAMTWIAAWRHRRDAHGPKLLFVGWRRLGLVVLCAVVAPLAAYGLWTRAPWGSARVGLNAALGRSAVEMGIASAVVLELSLMLAFFAARRRCREAGLAPATRHGMRWAVALDVLVLACAGVHVWITAGQHVFTATQQACALASFVGMVGGGAAVVIVALRRAWRRSAESEYARSVRRSMLPVLVAVLIALGLVGKLQLGLAERAEIARLDRMGFASLFLYEVDNTTARSYQQYLRSLPRNGAPSVTTEADDHAR